MKRFRAFIAALFLAASLEGGSVLTFDLFKVVENPHEEAFEREESHDRLTVLLGDFFLEERSADGIYLRDFAGKRVYHRDGTDAGFVESSLFAGIGFLAYEFQNRLLLGRVLAKADLEDRPLDRVLTEHLFSMLSGEESVLTREETDDRVTFSYEGRALATYSLDGVALEENALERYMLFLRYTYGMHPQIMDELEAAGRIPRELTVHRTNLIVETTRLRLEAIEEVAGLSPTEPVPLVLPQGDPLYPVMAQAAGLSGKGFAAACESLATRAVAAAEEGAFLDAIALFLGETLATGSPEFPSGFFRFKDAIGNDPSVALLLESIGPRSEEEATQAVANLERLFEEADEGKFLIAIFRANLLASLGKKAEAVSSFLEALAMEPVIAGAWKDLGELFYADFEAVRAWACWDAGRALKPDHAMFEKVNQLEDRLQADHPEFFLLVE